MMTRSLTNLAVVLSVLVTWPIAGSLHGADGESYERPAGGSTVELNLVEPAGYSVYVGDLGGSSGGCTQQSSGCTSSAGCAGSCGPASGCNSCNPCGGGCGPSSGCGSCYANNRTLFGGRNGIRSGRGRSGQSYGAYMSECDTMCKHWARMDFLHVFTSGRAVPPLVSTNSLANTGNNPGGVFAELDEFGVNTVFGGNEVGDDRKSGGRIEAGMWLDDYALIGIGVRGMIVEDNAPHFNMSGTGTDNFVLGRPFFDTNPVNAADPEATLIVARNSDIFRPLVTSGNVSVDMSHDIYMADAYLRYLLKAGNGSRLDLIGGYQYARIADSISIFSRSDILNGPVTDITDDFDAINEFHGGGMGLLGEWERGPVCVVIDGPRQRR